jgi:hypothetical protein
MAVGAARPTSRSEERPAALRHPLPVPEVDVGLTTVIEATNGLVSNNPATLSTLRAAAASSFQPEANLRIGSIELQTAPAPGSNR